MPRRILAGKQCDVEALLTGGYGGRDQNIFHPFFFKQDYLNTSPEVHWKLEKPKINSGNKSV